MIAAALSIGGPAAAAEATPLFANAEPLSISIAAPWREVARSAPEDEPIAATLTVGAETLPVLISTRGKSRRDKHVCEFPPLRVAFAEKPPETSAFHKQEKLKLVSYCKRSEKHQQLILLEYAAYGLYNVATPASFRARLARIAYVDAKKGKTEIERVGFFIEDVDDLARRVDMEEVERGRTPIALFDQNAAARGALFQYMIGNLDWDMTAGPPGEACCHNSKIIGPSATAESGLLPAPYDFDMAGIVDAPYAQPPDQFNIRSVRTRVFRGYCVHNEETRAAVADFRARREAFLQSAAATPGLSEGAAKKLASYLAGFFTAIADEASVEKNLIGKCRG